MLSTRSRLLIQLTATLAVSLAGLQAYAGDAERGKMLADTCKGCHAVDSYTNVYPTYHVPKVAGQNEEYLVSALTLYREGQRKHPTMKAQAGSLSDQDIQDIAAYMAGAAVLDDGNAKGSLPDAGQVCAACHGQAGVSPIPMNPNLAGQHADYLAQALKQYKSGDRQGPNAIAMQAQIMALSDDELKAIIAYYSSQDGLQPMQK